MGGGEGGEGVRLFYFCLFPSIPEDFNGLLGRAELQPTDGLTTDGDFFFVFSFSFLFPLLLSRSFSFFLVCCFLFIFHRRPDGLVFTAPFSVISSSW